MSHLDNHTVPSAGSASHIFCRNRGRHAPNWISLGALPLSVDTFTEGVIPFGSAVELQINRGFRLAWSTDASREMRMRSPKVSSAMPAGRIMMKPRSALSRSSPWQKEVAAGLRVEAWGPVATASCIVSSGQGAPTYAGQPCVAQSWSSAVAGWGVPAGGAESVGCCFPRKNVSRQGACCMSTAVAIARARRGSFGGGAGTVVPDSTQGEAGQGAAAASEAGLVFPAAEGVGLALLGSTQGEAGQGAAAASVAGLSVVAAEGAGTAGRTS